MLQLKYIQRCRWKGKQTDLGLFCLPRPVYHCNTFCVLKVTLLDDFFLTSCFLSFLLKEFKDIEREILFCKNAFRSSIRCDTDFPFKYVKIMFRVFFSSSLWKSKSVNKVENLQGQIKVS